MRTAALSFIPRALVTVLLIAGAGFLLVQTRAIDRLDLGLIGAIIAAQPPLIVAQGLLARRFQLAVARPEARFSTCLAGSLLGQATDLVLPWRLSEFARIVYLRDRAGVPVRAGLAAALIERSADLAVVALLLLLTVAFTAVDRAGWRVATLAVAASLVLLLLPLAAASLGRAIDRLPLRRLRRFAQGLLVELAGRVRDRVFWRVLGPTVLAWVAALLATWLLLAGVGAAVPVTLGLVLAVFVSTTIGAAAAILPAGVGTYEAGAVIVLRAYGVALDRAIAIAVALHIAQVLTSAVGGAVVAAASPLRFRDLIAAARAGLWRPPPSPDGGAS